MELKNISDLPSFGKHGLANLKGTDVQIGMKPLLVLDQIKLRKMNKDNPDREPEESMAFYISIICPLFTDHHEVLMDLEAGQLLDLFEQCMEFVGLGEDSVKNSESKET